MQALPFKLSKLAAGIGSVLWWMAYAPQLQAQPLQITVPIPLASTWPAYGRIAAEQRVAAWRAEHPEIAAAWRYSTRQGHAEGGPFSSNLPRNIPAAEPMPPCDPDAPNHGFDRTASLSNDTYVCECGGNGDAPEAAVRYAKPKRVRVRVKPLTAADIAVGAWYVPKRGNDKTPNLFVAAIDDAGVLYDRRRPDALSVGEVTRVSMADFLALVARRVDA